MNLLCFNSEWTANDQCIKIHFGSLATPVNMQNDWSFIHEQKLSIFHPVSFLFSLSLPLSDPTEAPAPPSRFHKLYNVQCRNKVDHLRAICLFSYLARFSFYLSPPLPPIPPIPHGFSSKLLWPLTERMENGEDDDRERRRRHWYSVDVRELHPEDRLAGGAHWEIFTRQHELGGGGNREPRIDREPVG